MLAEHIEKRGVSVVLLNSSALRLAGGGDVFDRCCQCCPGAVRSTRFTGHYVVVCGVDPIAKTVTFCDPASSATTSTVSYDAFDVSRHWEGTDDDIIFIAA
jgi:hypothetical protein